MKILKLLYEIFEQDPYKQEIKKSLREIDKKIVDTKNYNELLELCREYKLVEEKLNEDNNKEGSVPYG